MSVKIGSKNPDREKRYAGHVPIIHDLNQMTFTNKRDQLLVRLLQLSIDPREFPLELSHVSA
ncbi:MAG TPA: hypothetical protein VMZ24_07950 [Patescibacteria group bacterium]|nr:hypothetical protein [Patescibacteria group bacterium]